jgi:autotransporter-associated beta strand protein
MKVTKILLIFLAVSIVAPATFAGSARWSSNPMSGDWNTAGNWIPATIPNTQADTATFGTSNATNLTVGEWSDGSGQTDTMVHGIAFAPGANSYTITVTPVPGAYPSSLEIFLGGIRNSSGVTQNLVAACSGTSQACGRITFNSFGSAGENVMVINQGGDSADGDSTYGAFTDFQYNSSAGNSTFVNQGSTAADTVFGGSTSLLFYSSAESATFINNPGTVSRAAAGHTLVQTTGSIGNSTFICNPATVAGAEGGWIEYDGGVSAGAIFNIAGSTVAGAQAGQIYVYGGSGDASFIANGGNGSNAPGGLIDLFALTFSDQTVVTANGGINGGLGATILIEGTADVELPQFQVFGNGALDLTNATGTIAIGSLSGDGVVLLDGNTLNIGSNNFDATFSGVIQESGELTKAGTGTLTLTGSNAYTGTTTVTAGVLVVSNRTGSGTGTGPVNVNAGTLGGKGSITGAVTIGTGSGVGAFLTPSAASNQTGRLTLKKSLTFNSDSAYAYKLNTNNGQADLVRAKGITIESGAQFAFQPKGNHALTPGTVFTVLNNVSTAPIRGTFANLPDNSTLTVGPNNYQASYEGGDGNDLTLTVVP